MFALDDFELELTGALNHVGSVRIDLKSILKGSQIKCQASLCFWDRTNWESRASESFYRVKIFYQRHFEYYVAV
jgi:hypothetical protein